MLLLVVRAVSHTDTVADRPYALLSALMCATFIEPLCMTLCYCYMLYCRMWTLNVSLAAWISIRFWSTCTDAAQQLAALDFHIFPSVLCPCIQIMQVQVIVWKDLSPKWPILHRIGHKPILGTQYSMILQPLAAVSDILLWLRVIDFSCYYFLNWVCLLYPVDNPVIFTCSSFVYSFIGRTSVSPWVLTIHTYT